MTKPNYRKEVCKFIGLVTYYQDLWERPSHTSATLTMVTSGKGKFKWTEVKNSIQRN